MTRITLTIEGDASELAPVLLALADPMRIDELITEGVAAILTRRDLGSLSSPSREEPKEEPDPDFVSPQILSADLRTEPPAVSGTSRAAVLNGGLEAGASHPAEQGSGETEFTPPPTSAAAVPAPPSPGWRRHICQTCGAAFNSARHGRECLGKAWDGRQRPPTNGATQEEPPGEIAPSGVVDPPPPAPPPITVVAAEPDADGHTHRWSLSAPNHDGIVHGKCWCAEERDFDPEAHEFGRTYKDPKPPASVRRAASR